MKEIGDTIFDILKHNKSKFTSLEFTYNEGGGSHNRDMFILTMRKHEKDGRVLSANEVIKQEKQNVYILEHKTFSYETLDELYERLKDCGEGE